MPVNLFERVVSLINEASLSDSVREKVTRLTQVKELIVHRDSSLLDNFFEEVAAFQHDLNFEVRRVVIEFIQEACQVDPTLLKKGITYLFFLFSTAVQQDPPSLTLLRCLIQAMIPVYRIALTRAVKIGIVESGVVVSGKNGIAAESAADIALETFRNVASLKDEIVRLVLPTAVPGPSAFAFIRPGLLNDGVRSDALALVQSIIILHSRRLPNSDIPRSSEGDISLDQIPDMTNAQLQEVLNASTAASSASLLPGVCLVRPRRLAEEAERLLTGLLDWPIRGASATNIAPISCAVLELVMDSLVNVARQRPQFMDRIVQAFETVHVTLPPYFSDVQVSSVRKKLKAGLLQLLRCSAAVTDYQGRITILLTDLGATQNEVFEALHRINEFPLNRDTSASLEPATAHGDVDMRQMRPGSLTAASAAPQTNKPHPNASKTTPSTSISSTQSSTTTTTTLTSTTMDTTVGSTPLRATQPSQKPTSEVSESGKSFSGGFSLAQAEAALRFDDDDDDDDDIQILSSQRSRSNKAKRHNFATASSATAGTGSKEAKGTGASGTAKPELPSVDLVTTRLVPRLTAANVADLVLLSMVTLPDQMPAAFQSTYTPIAAAGTSAQIRHLARLLAVQLVVWAGESNHGDTTENMAQLESVLRPTEEELGEMPAPRHKRGLKSDLGGGLDGTTGDAKETGRVKKRRLASASTKAAAGDDAEVEDALIRANVARRMHGTQQMNISTLIGYGQKQQQQQEEQGIPISPVLDASAAGVAAGTISGLAPMFPNVQQPGGNLLLATFNPSQPPPPMMMMMMSNALNQSAANPAFAQIGTAMGGGGGGATASVPALSMADIPLPTAARPFSLEAVTAPIGLTTQRQLAQDAFMRIIEGLDGVAVRFPTGAAANQLVPADSLLASSSSSSFHLNRMKLLTRLTTRRFGGNEFYKILIEYAIKNLRHGFELLSKLLMQEYCRSRGFQLVGFNAFLKSRRQQLAVIRERQQRRRECSESVEPDEGGASKLTEDPGQSQGTTVTDDADPSSSTTAATEGREELTEDTADTNHSAVAQVADSSSKTVADDPTASKKEDSLEAKSNGLKKDDSSPVDSVSNLKAIPTTKTQTNTRERKPVLGINKAPSATPPDDLGCLSFYDCLLVDILQRLKQPELRQTYFGRFLIEAPLLTAGAISVLKRYCSNPSQAAYGFQILRTLIELRPVGQREYLLNMLLSFCAVEDTEIRRSALIATRELANLDVKWQHHIEAFATKILRKLTHSRPTADIYPFANHPAVPQKWNDESCQACAHLFLGLMPQSPSLMHKLAEVYVSACPEVKRCILRMIDQPIREIGIYSVDLHELVDRCPLGAETLITRMIHLLTDSPSAAAAAAATAAAASAASAAAPSATGNTAASAKSGASMPSVLSSGPPPVIMPPASLVERVYRLYQERVHDVRCLIPILVGLSKQDVIAALPRLIQLNEKVVKEVLTRLLNASVSTQYAPRVTTVKNMDRTTSELLGEAPLGPLKPEELLVAIHLLEFAKDPSETQPAKPLVSLQDILHACRVCFAERRLFTQDRLSAAIGQLLEQPVLPTLFMRTVMQALALHPRLAGYVINVLVRLIRKQVWKSKQLWDGFIRCCHKLHPQSYQVLLQLPPERLESVFQREPAMRAQVRRYVENFSSAQRVHISKSIIAVLERAPTPPPQQQQSANQNGPPERSVVLANGVPDTVEHPATAFPASPASSGPATPTRDEIPAHEVEAAIAAAAAIFQNPVAINANDSNLGDHHISSRSSDSGPLKVEGSTASTEPQHPLSVLVCNRSIGAIIGSGASQSMDERYQYVPRFRPSVTRSYMRVRNRSPHQEPSPPPEEPLKKELSEQHRRHSSTDQEPATKVKRIIEPLASEPQETSSSPVPLQSATLDDDLEPPVLPATRIRSTVPRRWRDLERSQVEKPTGSDNAAATQSKSLSEEDLTSSINLTAPESERPSKCSVDLDKLDADRKRLMEEAPKFHEQKAETKCQQSMDSDQHNPESNVNSPPETEST